MYGPRRSTAIVSILRLPDRESVSHVRCLGEMGSTTVWPRGAGWADDAEVREPAECHGRLAVVERAVQYVDTYWRSRCSEERAWTQEKIVRRRNRCRRQDEGSGERNRPV